jgi:hypothetical protein
MAYPIHAFEGKRTSAQYRKFWSIHGFDQLGKQLNIQTQMIEGANMKGLLRAAKFIWRETERTPPLTPVGVTEKLRSSFQIHANTGTVVEGGLSGITTNTTLIAQNTGRRNANVTFGYAANYALWVHEMVGAKFKREGAGAHWFKAAIERNYHTIVQIIEDNAKTVIK